MNEVHVLRAYYRSFIDHRGHYSVKETTTMTNIILFRYAPHYGIIMHTSYLPTGQQSRLKEVIQMEISSDTNPRRRRDNQFFLPFVLYKVSEFVHIYLFYVPCFVFAFSRGVPCSFTHIFPFRRFTLSFRRVPRLTGPPA